MQWIFNHIFVLRKLQWICKKNSYTRSICSLIVNSNNVRPCPRLGVTDQCKGLARFSPGVGPERPNLNAYGHGLLSYVARRVQCRTDDGWAS